MLKNIKFLSSHGFKSNSKYKISWHIIVKGYYFTSNSECKYVCEKLKELDDAYFSIGQTEEFRNEFTNILKNYIGKT